MSVNDNFKYVHIYEPGQGEHQTLTLLLLHGTGGDENDLRELGRMLLPGAAQLRPRGNVVENGMPRFFRRFAEGVLDVEDLKLRAGELAEFLHQASATYGFDERQVIAAGFSNGANIAAGMLLLYPQVLRAAILLHPMVPFEPEIPPDLRNKPLFIGAGRNDPLVSVQQTAQLAEILRNANANLQLSWQNGGHNVSVDEVRAAKNWLNQLLA